MISCFVSGIVFTEDLILYDYYNLHFAYVIVKNITLNVKNTFLIYENSPNIELSGIFALLISTDRCHVYIDYDFISLVTNRD